MSLAASKGPHEVVDLEVRNTCAGQQVTRAKLKQEVLVTGLSVIGSILLK